MKQKYSIVRDDKNNQLIIREFAELDKQILSLLCEETYNSNMIHAAIKQGSSHLISALRTNNLYPPGIYAAKIAESVMQLYATKSQESVDLFFDDLELLAVESRSDPEPDDEEKPVEERSEDVNELLEDDFESEYQEKDKISKMNSSLKIADDDYSDSPNDS
ncbi:MAG: hypothetical protein PVI00_05170 [Desulfobacterales bacterium]|jgi:hypothetical protein